MFRGKLHFVISPRNKLSNLRKNIRGFLQNEIIPQIKIR